MNSQPTELAILGVSPQTKRFSRIITPAQEGLLDTMSHADAVTTRDSLLWMLDHLSIPAKEYRDEVVTAHLLRLRTIIAWMGDLIQETE